MTSAEAITEGRRKTARLSGNGKAVTQAKARRLNINLPEKTFQELERLAAESGRTMTDLVRVAISLAQVAIDEKDHGRKLAVIDQDGKLLKELVLSW